MSGTPIYDNLIVCQEVRNNHPDLKIVWGGTHPTILPEQTVKHPLVDIVVRGSAEETSVQLARALKDRHYLYRMGLKNIKGLTYKDDGKVISTPDAEFPDINKYPMMDYEGLDDMETYVSKTPEEKLGYDDFNTRTSGFASSRGCPHRCGFCSISSFCQRQWRFYPPERVVKEMKMLVEKYDINGFVFNDDNFFVSRERVEKICDLMVKEGLSIKWGANCRIDYFDKYSDDFIRKLKRAGCVQLFFGAESGSQRILDYMKKGITVEQTLDSAKRCKRLGLRAKYFFMMGFPNETLEDLHMTIDLIDEIYGIFPDSLQPILIYTPYEKTFLMEESKKLGLVPPDTLEGWGEYNFLKYEIPYGDAKFVGTVKTVSMISHFLLGYQRGERFPKRWQRIGYWFLKKDAKFRWKHKVFGFAPEWNLVHRYMNSQMDKQKERWLSRVRGSATS